MLKSLCSGQRAPSLDEFALETPERAASFACHHSQRGQFCWRRRRDSLGGLERAPHLAETPEGTADTYLPAEWGIEPAYVQRGVKMADFPRAGARRMRLGVAPTSELVILHRVLSAARNASF